MRAFRVLLACLSVVAFAACGDVRVPSKTQTSARQALIDQPEMVEFETVEARQELFRDIARIGRQEQGLRATESMLFPMSRGAELVGAPAFESDADLLLASDAGLLALRFDARWPEERRDSLGGLSEREAAELVVHSLLGSWGVGSGTEVDVERAPGAPYAVAYVDGILRINPVFLYLVAATPAGGDLQP